VQDRYAWLIARAIILARLRIIQRLQVGLHLKLIKVLFLKLGGYR
jgi:hypothetical protein